MKLVRQVDRTDCGPACLAMVLGYWGRKEPLYRLRTLAGTTQSGTSMLGLVRAGRQLGLEVRALEADLEGLRTLRTPLVLHWEHNHYVVLVRLTPRKVQIADPAVGLRWIGLEELQKKWTGKLLWLKPGPAFERGNFVGKRGLKGFLAHLAHFRGAGGVLLELTLATIALSLLGLGGPVLSQLVFDRVLTFREESLLPYLLVAIFALTFFQTLLASLRAHLATQLSMRLNYRLKLSYLHHLLRLPLRTLEARLPGDLLSRFGDLGQVESILRNLLVGLPPTLLTLVLSFALLFTYNPKLAWVALLVVPIHLVYLLWLALRLRENSRQSLRKGAEVDSYVLGSLEGVTALKALRGEGWALSRGRDQIAGLNDILWQGFLLSNWGGALVALLGGLFSLFLLWYGAGLVLRLELTVGQLVAAYGLVQGVTAALGTLSGTVMAIQQGIVASDRLAEVVELEPEQEQKNAVLRPLERAIALEHLCFSYLPERPLLKDLCLELPKGSYTAIVGPNGAGKSTLGGLLARMLEPQSGRISWDGRDLAELSPDAVRERVAYLRQEVPLFYATLRENLSLGHPLPEERLWRVLELVGLMPAVRRLPEGLDTTVGGESLYRFSSGERQLLGVARALLSPADLLILDEPTATLDPDKERQIVALLRAFKGERTLLVITHRPALLEPADQVFALQDGVLKPVEPVLQGV